MKMIASATFGACLIGLLTADLRVWAQNDAARWEREAREVVENHIRASNCGTSRRSELARKGIALDDPCSIALKQYWGAGNFPWIMIGPDGSVSTRAATAQDAEANLQRGEPKIEDCSVKTDCVRDHTTWDRLEVVHVSENKVHLTTTLTRRDRNGKALETIPTLWIVGRQKGHWGIQVQSFLPGTKPMQH